MVDTLNLFGEEMPATTPAKKPKTASKSKKKSDRAYRTISEVAEELGVATHVLRFWESKFDEVEPMKRGGGRRYYKPEDVELLKRIQTLLYDEGYTIRGVQTYLKKGGLEPTEATTSNINSPSLIAELQEIKALLEG